MESVLMKRSIPLSAKVLLIADDQEAAQVWAFSLSNDGFVVKLTGMSEPVKEVWAREQPDMIIGHGKLQRDGWIIRNRYLFGSRDPEQ
jgi:hypothetical protein